jgi:hypothetical protein
MTRSASSPVPASDNRIFLGAFLELLLIVANIGTAVVLFPILRRQNEILALGYVIARVVECVFIAVGILAVLTVVTLGEQRSGVDAGEIAYALAALKDWTFILGPGFVVGIGNGLLLGYLMYQSGLVPRQLAVFGDRRPADLHLRSPRDVRRHRPGWHWPRNRDHPGVHLGTRPRPLADVQGLQAVTGPLA